MTPKEQFIEKWCPDINSCDYRAFNVDLDELLKMAEERCNKIEIDRSEADGFYDTLKADPAKIINWAEAEIKEYQKLIKLLSK